MSTVDPKLVAVRAAAAAIEPFRAEHDRAELLWRVAKVLDLDSKDLRPCCAHDDAPCIHQGRDCDCWACRQLVAGGAARVDRDPLRWQCSGCRWGFTGKWKQICPACGRSDYWSGSVHPEAKRWTPDATTPPTARGFKLDPTDE